MSTCTGDGRMIILITFQRVFDGRKKDRGPNTCVTWIINQPTNQTTTTTTKHKKRNKKRTKTFIEWRKKERNDNSEKNWISLTKNKSLFFGHTSVFFLFFFCSYVWYYWIESDENCSTRKNERLLSITIFIFNYKCSLYALRAIFFLRYISDIGINEKNWVDPKLCGQISVRLWSYNTFWICGPRII